ncbi:MAG: HTTM domain-containing protein [Spongiibacteraceae bacterium]
MALRLTEILLGWAFIQQSAEYLNSSIHNRILFSARLLLSSMLVVGLYTQWVCLALLLVSMVMLIRFQGPYNGGSDRMGLLILLCLSLAQLLPSQKWREHALGYLALQLVLSYFISGWVKVVNPDWRNGRALQDVFLFSAYPASESLRAWANHPRLILFMSWAVMIFELLFPFTILSSTTLAIGLIIAALFHLANACLFGLNRFFWVWLAAYPSIVWLQHRIFSS